MLKDDCIFCKIIKGEIPSTKVYEDDKCLAFRDINPQTPVHILMVPKTHIACAADLTEADEALIGHIFTAIAKIAKDEHLDKGFRVITNSGKDAGQTVDHLHFHIMGGVTMGEKLI